MSYPSSVACPPSSGTHSQRAIEADDFAVEVAVLDHVADERSVLRRLAEQFWERHRSREALLRGFRQRMQHRGGENPRRDGVDADAELGELARRRHDERHDTALRRRVRSLADLTLIGGDGGGADDNTALAVL